MALPINVTPTYTLTIPSTKKAFKYRPFLVKDEKALLIAQQSEDQTIMLDTLKEVILSCAKDDIDVNKLASFDIEYIFTQLRSVSVGEIVELIFQCDVCPEEDARATVNLNLNKLRVDIPEGHTNKIPLFGDVGVMMKYPTIDVMKKLIESNDDDVDQAFAIVAECIDFIYDSDEIFQAKDQKKEELTEFLNNLTAEQYESIQQFFRTIPTLRADVNYKCPKCGKDHDKYMEGLSSFF